MAPSIDDNYGSVRLVVVDPNDRDVYVMGPGRLFKVDLVERRITASVPVGSRGELAISAIDERIYLTDPGDGRDDPGSGTLFVFTTDLVPLAPIDLMDAAIEG